MPAGWELRMAMTTRARGVIVGLGPQRRRRVLFPSLRLPAFVAEPDAVVQIAIAYRSQALVVERRDAAAQPQFLLEMGQSAHRLGQGRDFGVRRLEELLVAAIHQPGQLAPHDQPGGDGDLHLTPGLAQDGRASGLSYEYLAVTQRADLKAHGAQLLLRLGQGRGRVLRTGHDPSV